MSSQSNHCSPECQGHSYHYFLQEQVNMIDDMYIRPKLQQNATTSDLEDITRHYEKLVMK